MPKDPNNTPNQPSQKPIQGQAEADKVLTELGDDPQQIAEEATKKPKAWHGWSKKRKIVVTVLAVLLLCGLVASAAVLIRKKPTVQRRDETAKVLRVAPKPKTLPSPLTGVEVSPQRAEHAVTSVVIENLYPSARPQSGLSSAGVVYEALAEGGITRDQAFFGDTFPADIGPIRSIRTHFVRWGLEYGVSVVHAGGNADALDMITPLGLKNLDQFANGSYFRRITTRYAPHNLYTTGPQLESLLQAKGFNTKPSFKVWQRKDDSKATAPIASTITISPSYYDYEIGYTFDPTSDSYTRTIRGEADVDANGNVPIKPKNVMVLKVPTSYGLTRTNEDTVIIQQVGSGKGWLFMDGNAIEISWQKTSDSAQTTYTDLSGKPIVLNRGQTWVTVIPTDKAVTYK